MNDPIDEAKPANPRRRFDPRFSPEFQPGYDPHAQRREPPTAPLRDETSGGWDDGSVDSPSINPGADSYAANRPGADLPVPADSSGLVDEPDATDEPAAWRQRTNPWIIVLWVLGVVFIAGGIATIYVVAGMSSTFSANGFPGFPESLFYQMALSGAPMLIVLGLATVTASIVVFAIRWRHH